MDQSCVDPVEQHQQQQLFVVSSSVSASSQVAEIDNVDQICSDHEQQDQKQIFTFFRCQATEQCLWQQQLSALSLHHAAQQQQQQFPTYCCGTL